MSICDNCKYAADNNDPGAHQLCENTGKVQNNWCDCQHKLDAVVFRVEKEEAPSELRSE